ncbi:MAG: hypothetical protein HON90_15265 [Halobacteriovoraceae bacterium]|jgi:acyl carrier protein|nr:hypothetical protein [Halobacteriovoraceae bacterium]
MIDLQTSKKIINDALITLNEELDDDEKIIIGENTVLFGLEAEIDSLSLVSLVVDIETVINCEHDYDIALTDDRAMTRDKSPFDNVNALAEYITELTGEN